MGHETVVADPVWFNALPARDRRALFDGLAIMVGNGRVYQVCWACRKVVHVNKVFFGAMHLCTPGPGAAV